MSNRRLPNWGYKGRPPRTKGTESTASEVLQGVKTHEEAYMLKAANQFDYPRPDHLHCIALGLEYRGPTLSDTSWCLFCHNNKRDLLNPCLGQYGLTKHGTARDHLERTVWYILSLYQDGHAHIDSTKSNFRYLLL